MDITPHTSDRPPMVAVDSVTRSFHGAGGRIVAVDDVSLTVEPGEVVAVLGPNGAGKTTLLDMVLGLNTPERGSIRVDGITPKRAVQGSRVGALLQTGGLLPDLTVAETVRMIAALHRHHTPVEQVMETAGLTGIAGRRVGKCSGGEQQRVKFALALLPDPDLLILDEPTAGMDVSARHEFWQRMHAQADAGTTVLFATHYLEEAEQFARRTVLMGAGRIIADGPTDEVRAQAASAHVTVTWSPTAEQLDGLPAVASSEVIGTQVRMRTDDADTLARHLLTRTDAYGITVTQASLEEAFMTLTGAETTKETQR
ncbi:MAG: ABC transporter ATP-binding protein [Nesterenkonia sp.]|nr:ABC transporter ATP-binding protein [Nesterenkonia sp.]